MQSTSTELKSFQIAKNEYDYRQRIHPINFFKLLPMQKLFYNDPAKFKIIFGGNRSSKTTCGSYYVIKKCLENPGFKCWCVAETFQDSVAIQQRKVWDLVPKDRIKYGNYDVINGFTNRKLLFDNGSLITFKSYDQKREAFQGENCNLIHNDEECPFDIYKEQRMRLIDHDGEMIITMTSLKGVTELVDDVFTDYEATRTGYAEYVNETLPLIAKKDGISLYFFWTVSNPYISQERLLSDIKLMPRDEIKARIYGVPINITGRIYTAMSRDVHVTDIESMPAGKYTIYHILDPHDRKPWAMGWIAVHKTGTAYVIDEYPNKPFIEMKYDDKTYEDYAAIIRAKEDNIKDLFGTGVTRRILDPNFGNKTVQLARRQGGQANTTPKKQLAKLGFQFRDGIDALEAGHLAVREWLYYDKADSGEIIVQPKLMFCDNCQNHIIGMLRYSRKDVTTPSGDEKDKVGPQDKWKDFPDLCRYAVMSGLQYIEPKREEEKTKKAY